MSFGGKAEVATASTYLFSSQKKQINKNNLVSKDITDNEETREPLEPKAEIDQEE